MTRKSGLSGLILFGTLLLVGCADKAEVQCSKRVEAGYQAGYDKAVADLHLENLQNLRGDQLACQVYEKLPTQLQNLAGLDCTTQWPSGLENVSSAMRIGPAAVLALIVFLGFGFFYFILPALGGFAGQATAAMALKIQPVRKQILSKVHDEEANLRVQLEPLRVKIRDLQNDAKAAADKAAEAKKSEVLARESLGEVLEQVDTLRDELEHRISLSKKAESTADLTSLLGQIGKKPSK